MDKQGPEVWQSKHGARGSQRLEGRRKSPWILGRGRSGQHQAKEAKDPTASETQRHYERKLLGFQEDPTLPTNGLEAFSVCNTEAVNVPCGVEAAKSTLIWPHKLLFDLWIILEFSGQTLTGLCRHRC